MYALGASARGFGAVSPLVPYRTPKGPELAKWLLAVAERSDVEAFNHLFEHFAPRLIGFFSRAGLPRDVAEEVAQETMVSVWTKARLYDPREAGVSTWIYTIARNARIDRLRREGRRAKLETAVSEEDREEPFDASGEDVLLAAERDDAVREALKTLPAEQAEVVRLSFFAEKPHSEIARDLGLPLGTVKSRLRLAMSKIRAAWEDER
jgi:RNA polymerase sigma-70 factor, ECF subfamily